MPVSLPSSGVSINPGGESLIPSTLDLPAQGVSLKVGVSITGGGGGVPGNALLDRFGSALLTRGGAYLLTR